MKQWYISVVYDRERNHFSNQASLLPFVFATVLLNTVCSRCHRLKWIAYLVDLV